MSRVAKLLSLFVRFSLLIWLSCAWAADIVYLDTDCGRKLLNESISDPKVVSLFMNYETQKTTSYCGVASLVMTYNALGIDAPPSDIFPNFRKFSQQNIFDEALISVVDPDCITKRGLEIDEVAVIASNQGLAVETVYGDTLAVDEFKAKLQQTLQDPAVMVIANYYRPYLDQGHTGHFSPVATYHPQSDRFLVMDTARYRLPPSWIKASDLHQSMQRFSPHESRRGFLVLRQQPAREADC